MDRPAGAALAGIENRLLTFQIDFLIVLGIGGSQMKKKKQRFRLNPSPRPSRQVYVQLTAWEREQEDGPMSYRGSQSFPVENMGLTEVSKKIREAFGAT